MVTVSNEDARISSSYSPVPTRYSIRSFTFMNTTEADLRAHHAWFLQQRWLPSWSTLWSCGVRLRAAFQACYAWHSEGCADWVLALLHAALRGLGCELSIRRGTALVA